MCSEGCDEFREGSKISDASPRSTGPAGPQFEAKVGTHYALAVLANTESFGLPGAIVDRIEFQRGGQGHPLVQSDIRLIEGDTEDRSYLASLRGELWPRLKQTWHWRSHLWSTSDGMEIHLKELVSAYFMRASYGFGEGQAYTKGLSDPELAPFMPLLLEIVGEAPSCPNIAYMYLHILECQEPSTAEVPLAAAAAGWAKAANNRFWNELGIGRRVLSIGHKAAQLSDTSAWYAVCEALMAAGVPVDADFLRRVQS